MPAVDRHAVLGDRTRLVRADHRRRPEALDRGQPSHERPLGRHPSNAQGERGGRDRGQTLGHGGDGERDHRAEHLDQWHAAQQPEHERAAAERERHADELAAESIELALERRRRRRRLADQSADAPDLGITSRGRDDGESRAFGDDGAGEDHVDAVGEPGVVGAHLVRPLRDGKAFAGQRRLVHREGLHLDEAGVGGDLVTGPQHQDVADDERGGRDQDVLVLTADEGARHRRVLERHQDALYAPLGDVADHGVDADDGDDHARIDDRAADDRQGRRHAEHENRHRHHVAGDDLERRLRSRFGQAVVAEAGEPRPRLLDVEPGCDRRLEAADHAVGRERVPALGTRASGVVRHGPRRGGFGDDGQQAAQVERGGVEDDQDVAGEGTGLNAADRRLSSKTRGQSGCDIGLAPKTFDSNTGTSREGEDRSYRGKDNGFPRRPASSCSRLHTTPATARGWRARRRASGLLGGCASQARSRVRRCNATSLPGTYGSWPPRTRRRRRPGARSADAPAPPNHPLRGPERPRSLLRGYGHIMSVR